MIKYNYTSHSYKCLRCLQSSIPYLIRLVLCRMQYFIGRLIFSTRKKPYLETEESCLCPERLTRKTEDRLSGSNTSKNSYSSFWDHKDDLGHFLISLHSIRLERSGGTAYWPFERMQTQELPLVRSPKKGKKMGPYPFFVQKNKRLVFPFSTACFIGSFEAYERRLPA